MVCLLRATAPQSRLKFELAKITGYMIKAKLIFPLTYRSSNFLYSTGSFTQV